MSVLREIAQKVKELLDDLETLEQEEKTTDFEYPFEIGDECFFINIAGEPVPHKWSQYVHEKHAYRQGNVFKTRKEAERERDRRELLMRFKQFRDKCNGDWRPGEDDEKHYIIISGDKLLFVATDVSLSSYPTFGYFKTEFDCLHAIDLFGDEIKRLWVDE